MTCDQENTCSVGESETISYTIGFSLTGGSEVTKWISGGFDVSVSWSTGNQYTCNGGPSDTVCIWQKVAHTAVGVVLPYVFKAVDIDYKNIVQS